MDQQFTEKPHILAVDDELLNIELLRFIIERQGFNYTGTSTIAQFMASLEQQIPDLILLDVVMPNTNGFEFCKQLKKTPEYADIPVIFITGKIKVKDKVEGFEAGGVDYVTKPFNELELMARIKTHVDLKRAKNRIEIQAENLRQSNALKDRMFSIIGHDLRSPLSAAKLKMDFILRGIIDPTAEDFKEKTVYELLTTMDESLDLLQNLLGWAKSESGKIHIIPEVLDLHDLAAQTFRLLKLGSEHKNITLTNNVPKDTYVNADMNTIKTVLRNLVSNAIKFTPTDGEIKLNAVLKGDRTIIEIEDNGQGIPKEDIPKILNPNEHFSKLGTNNEPGTGLGLVLCQRFVDSNGGTLKIKSTVGKGSTFYFDLAVAEKVMV